MARLSYESARPHLGLPMPPASLTGIGLRNLAVMGAVVLFSLLVLVKLGFGGGGSVSSRWSLPGSSAGEGAPLLAAAAARPAGDYALQGPPSVTAEQIDRILTGQPPGAVDGTSGVSLPAGHEMGEAPTIGADSLPGERTGDSGGVRSRLAGSDHRLIGRMVQPATPPPRRLSTQAPF